MSQIDALEQTWKYGEELVATVQSEELSLPTPCAGWDVRGLLNHLLGESTMQTEVNHGLPSKADHGDLLGEDDTVAVWNRIAADNVASWREGGVEGERRYFYGTFPAPVALASNIAEVVVHSWDLATALGRPVSTDPAHAEIAWELWSSFPVERLDALRVHGQFRPEVAVAADAPAMDRLLGLLGRQP